MCSEVAPQFGFSGPRIPTGGGWELIVTQTEGAEGRTEECVAVGDRCAAFGGDRLEVGQTVSIPFLFHEPIEACETVFQFRGRSLQCVSQLRLTTSMNMVVPLRFR